MKVYSIKPNSYFVRVSDGRVLEFVDRTAPEVVVADVLGDEALAKNICALSGVGRCSPDGPIRELATRLSPRTKSRK